LYDFEVQKSSNLPSDITCAHVVINELTLENFTLLENNSVLTEKNTELQQRIDWFTRQIFGERSEKIIHSSERGSMERLWLGWAERHQNKMM